MHDKWVLPLPPKIKGSTRSATIIFHVFNAPIPATTSKRVCVCWLHSFIKQKIMMDKTLLKVAVERVVLSSWANQPLRQGRIISGRNKQSPFHSYPEWIPLYSGIKNVMVFKDFFLVKLKKKKKIPSPLKGFFFNRVHYLHVSIQLISFKANQSKTARVYGVKGDVSHRICRGHDLGWI